MYAMYGLIGRHLSHSASPKLFEPYLAPTQSTYQLYTMDTLEQVLHFLDTTQHVRGLNVTFPYKMTLMPHLASVDPLAQRIGAVNTLLYRQNAWHGYNTDYAGVDATVRALPPRWPQRPALILGTGGAAQAAACWLTDHNHAFDMASRTHKGTIRYDQIQTLKPYGLIIHATPLGTYPNTQACITLPIHTLNPEHLLFDMVYNPPITQLMRLCVAQGAYTRNGLLMLQTQAQHSWKIWTQQLRS